MTTPRTLLLSLRPRFANAILSGTKTVELRRRPINAQPDTPIILYASSPTMAIVGTARLREIQTLKPETAWRQHHLALGLERSEFDDYLQGAEHAYLLLLHRVCTLDQPLPLRELRQEGRFQPPQSFRYVADADPSPLRTLVAATGQARGAQREPIRPDTVRKPVAQRSTQPAPSPATTSQGRIRRHAPASKIADS